MTKMKVMLDEVRRLERSDSKALYHRPTNLTILPTLASLITLQISLPVKIQYSQLIP